MGIKERITTVIEKNGSGNMHLPAQGTINVFSSCNVFHYLKVICLRPRVQTCQADSLLGGVKSSTIESDISANKDAEWFV